MLNFIQKWRNKYIARQFVKDCTAVIRNMYPDDEFQIHIEVVDHNQAQFYMSTKSDNVMACWILIQESIKVCNELDNATAESAIIEPQNH